MTQIHLHQKILYCSWYLSKGLQLMGSLLKFITDGTSFELLTWINAVNNVGYVTDDWLETTIVDRNLWKLQMWIKIVSMIQFLRQVVDLSVFVSQNTAMLDVCLLQLVFQNVHFFEFLLQSWNEKTGWTKNKTNLY